MTHRTTVFSEGRTHLVYATVAEGIITSVKLGGDLMDITARLSPKQQRSLERRLKAVFVAE